MIQRIALILSFVAVAAAVGVIVLLGGKLSRLSLRVSALERKGSAPPAPPPPAPPPSPVQTKESPQEAKRKRIIEIAEKENQAQLDGLVRDLALDSRRETQLRAAFIDEFRYYAEGVARDLEALEREDTGSSLLTGIEFRAGLEDLISAADRRVRDLLNPSQRLTFENWRRALRKDRYELD